MVSKHALCDPNSTSNACHYTHAHPWIAQFPATHLLPTSYLRYLDEGDLIARVPLQVHTVQNPHRIGVPYNATVFFLAYVYMPILFELSMN